MTKMKKTEYSFLSEMQFYPCSTSMNSGQSKSLKEKLFGISPRMLARLLTAKKKCRTENRDLMPKDLFHLKGFMCAGTDNRCYKADLEKMWGIAPREIFAGTEPTCIGCETWSREGVYFFPDSCFYEFIPEEELDRNINPKLAQKILSPMEKAQFHSASDKQRALLTFWVLKEAAAKLTGDGLKGYPNHTNFTLDDPRVSVIDGCLVAILED